jgi:hypothetical protein
MTEPHWTGDERRSIPIHILTYVKEIVTDETREIKESFAQYRQEFSMHDADEMARYDQILNNQKRNADAAEERYSQLIRTVESYATKAEQFHEDVKSAFLTNRHGKVDYSGHANAHEAWIRQAEENKKLLKDIKTAIIIALAIGLGGWLLSLTWAGVLKGPQMEQHSGTK